MEKYSSNTSFTHGMAILIKTLVFRDRKYVNAVLRFCPKSADIMNKIMQQFNTNDNDDNQLYFFILVIVTHKPVSYLHTKLFGNTF